MDRHRLLEESAISTPLHGRAPTVFVRHLAMQPVTRIARPDASRIRPRDAQEDAFKSVVDQECGWIRDQIETDVRTLGAGPVVVGVTHNHSMFAVTFLLWRANGMAAQESHEFRDERPKHGDPLDERKLRRFVSGRFRRMLEGQAERVRQWGEPRRMAPDEIELGRYRIEKPLRAMMDRVFGADAGTAVRKALADSDATPFRTEGYGADERLVGAGIGRFELSFPRDGVAGAFSFIQGGVTFVWSKGSLALFGMDLPDTAWTGCPGKRLGQLIEHPLFDGDMVITDVHASKGKGDGRGSRPDGWTLTLKDTMEPMPDAW